MGAISWGGAVTRCGAIDCCGAICWGGAIAWCGWRICGGRAPVGTGDVEDDLRRLAVLLIDSGEGAEELAGDVGEDGGLASGDFVLREEDKETREEGVDLNGVGEVVELGAESGGEFSCVEVRGGFGEGW